ncbi:MAG TPA: GyrI-like domain-containing protein [Gemmatimonadales bacterium]|nr:GyrI-like domain-containing protein [Gemmatimonadales bacterium]
MAIKPELRQATPKRVAGLALRTDNATEARAGGGKIPDLWQRFRSEDWFGRLGQLGAVGPPLGVYSAYESDRNGSFQILAGREIKSSANVPAPLQVVSVPSGSYLVFQSSGPLPGSVVKGWQDVWAYFERPRPRPRDFARAYTCDFEIYPSAETVEIWVAVQKS